MTHFWQKSKIDANIQAQNLGFFGHFSKKNLCVPGNLRNKIAVIGTKMFPPKLVLLE